MAIEETDDIDDICNVSRGINNIKLDILEDSNGVQSDYVEVSDKVMLDHDSSFSPVKSPRKKKSKRSSENMNDQFEGNFPSTAISSFLLVKINRNIEEEDDIIKDSMMETVRSIFKVILRLSNKVGICGPTQLKLPAIYNNRQLPKKLETNSIQKHIHFGRMAPTPILLERF